jgi:hypothetical protein
MTINSILRLFLEYRSLSRILSTADLLAFVGACVVRAPDVVRSGKLICVDAAMSRNLAIRYRRRRINLPIADIDTLLAAHRDNPTFGNLREMYAKDCYLRRLRFASPIGPVLDLGANRGLFSLIALLALDADRVVGVEPLPQYDQVMRLLLQANNCDARRVIRYRRSIGSSAAGGREPERFISIERIRDEQGVARFGLVKMDVEGGESDLFDEPDWLAHVDNLSMELHHHLAGDLASIPGALESYGLHHIATDQFGRECPFANAMYLYASRAGALC